MEKIKKHKFAPLRGGKCPKDKRGAEKAFTLAEILITLSIIGVVAALTIPTLIQRTGNEEFVSRLMKVYSILSQATETIITENGSPVTWASSVENIYTLYKEHLRIAQDCGSAAGCFKQSDKGIHNLSTDPSRTDLNGDSVDGNSYDSGVWSYAVRLSDGTQILFNGYDISSSCKKDWGGEKNGCIRILVDTNGEKKPNRYGRDIFWFILTGNGLIPAGCGSADVTQLCNTKSYSQWGGSQSFGCACRVISEGAMNY